MSTAVPGSFAGRRSRRRTRAAASDVDFRRRLLSVLPVELVAGYTLIDIAMRDIDSAVWNLVVIALTVGFTAWYMISEYGSDGSCVRQKRQVWAGILGSVVYAFGIGGWCSRQWWYAPWQGLGAIVFFAIVIRILRIDPEHDADGSG